LALPACPLQEGYAAQNMAFGMGGGLLQKVNRDTMSFATKLSHIVYADGRAADVMKRPKTDVSCRLPPAAPAQCHDLARAMLHRCPLLCSMLRPSVIRV
jgi:nicotinic acid phosphoribosyltransferase